MEKMLKKENFIYSGLDRKGKKEFLFTDIVTFIAFILSAFALWEIIYEFCNMIGSIVEQDPAQTIVELRRVIPFLVVGFTFMSICIWVFNAYNACNMKKRVGIWKRNGIATIVVGIILIGYIVYGLISGEYEKLIEGFPSVIFPLDIIITGCLFIIVGILAVIYSKKLKSKWSSLPFGSKKCALHGIKDAFICISYIIGACGFAACCYTPFIADFGRGDIIFNIAMFLNYFTAFAMIFTYRYLYYGLKIEFRRKFEVRVALIFLLVNACLLTFYLLVLAKHNEAANLNALPLIPIDFTASTNTFPVIYGLNNLIAPLIALIPGRKR